MTELLRRHGHRVPTQPTGRRVAGQIAP
jgi:hypothetical protein